MGALLISILIGVSTHQPGFMLDLAIRPLTSPEELVVSKSSGGYQSGGRSKYFSTQAR